MGLWERIRYGRDDEPLGDRLRNAVLKPADSDSPPAEEARSVEELQWAVRHCDDKERLIGLLAAPFAAAIGLLIISALVAHDPSALLKNGQPNKAHVSVSLYRNLELVLLALSVAMLAFAWFRKRLLLGIAMALYGLAVFNLHYWGFGVPYLLVGAWYLVRAYRLQRDLREATASEGAGSPPGRPRASKRYTPPA